MAGPISFYSVLFAVGTGLIPSLIWLYFWMRRDRSRPEPFGLLTICFLLGAAAVIIAIPIQKIIRGAVDDSRFQIVLWAAVEEMLKFLPVYIVALRSRFNDEAIDPAMYMIAAALGFAALENIAYALQPAHVQNVTAGLLNGSLRFFGATLLHAVASGFVGIVIGLSPRYTTWFFGIFGIMVATFLHSTFNFFIMKHTSATFLQMYGFLWVAAIISLVTLEKLRRIPPRLPQTQLL